VAARAVDGSALCLGASRPHVRLGGLPHAALEAREALRIGRRVYGPGRLVAYADLGLYRVLHALRDTPELRAFYEQTLGLLVEYDRKTGQNLIETLEAFFSCHGNLSQTAMRLQLHRNSLLYRIGRIQEIGGVDLEDPEIRLSLQVALKARRLLT
jgi:purine catabolism regulator